MCHPTWVWTSCVPVSHGAVPSGGTTEAQRDVPAQGEFSCCECWSLTKPCTDLCLYTGNWNTLQRFVWAVLHGRELQEHRRAFKMLRKQEKYVFTHTHNYFVLLICFVAFFKNMRMWFAIYGRMCLEQTRFGFMSNWVPDFRKTMVNDKMLCVAVCVYIFILSLRAMDQ